MAVTGVRAGPTGISRVLKEMRKEWTAYLFLSPGLLLFCIFVIFSVGFSFYLSFHKWDILQPQKPWVGLENYKDLIGDKRFRQALWVTTYYTAVSVPVTLASGLLVALLLNNRLRARGLFRTLYYLPVVTPLVVAAIIWKWVYNSDYGLLNYYLMKLNIIDKPLLWLADKNLAMPSVILVSVWKGAGGAMVIFLAGLQAIPQEYYDAAKVDGASAFQRLRHITVPLLRPTTFFLLIISLIGAFQEFTLPFVMTNGGPLRRTTTVGYYLYQTGFKQFNMGYAAAMAYALFAIMFLFTLLQWRYFRREVEH